MFFMLYPEYKIAPKVSIFTARMAETVLSFFEFTLDFMITMINLKIVPTEIYYKFIEVFNELHSPDTPTGVSLYDNFVREALMINKKLNEKLSIVMNFISTLNCITMCLKNTKKMRSPPHSHWKF